MATTSKFSKARAISTAFGWDSHTRVACARAYFLCSGNFCDVARMLGNKTCLEVAEFCEFDEINDNSLRQQVLLFVRRLRVYWKSPCNPLLCCSEPAVPHRKTVERRSTAYPLRILVSSGTHMYLHVAGFRCRPGYVKMSQDVAIVTTRVTYIKDSVMGTHLCRLVALRVSPRTA